MTRKIGAIVLLLLLLGVPFLDWRLGAVIWMAAWLTFILQKLFTRRNWKIGEETDNATEITPTSDSDNSPEPPTRSGSPRG
ncbi:MAG: hypothetical protein KKG47_16675 [Proteobacteria bacterium]|nr:hypothetical protein [Pseudomonadota bacterium]MBU1738665.1 hypothetical protein [Pseudomonadota bacterium]